MNKITKLMVVLSVGAVLAVPFVSLAQSMTAAQNTGRNYRAYGGGTSITTTACQRNAPSNSPAIKRRFQSDRRSGSRDSDKPQR